MLDPGRLLPVTWSPTDKAGEIFLVGNFGNLRCGKTSVDTHRSIRASPHARLATGGLGWYYEVALTSLATSASTIGVANSLAPMNNYIGSDSNGWAAYTGGGSPQWPAGITTGVVGIALQNGNIWFAHNNTWIGDPAAGTGASFTGITGLVFPAMSLFTTSNQLSGRFKTADFTYSPPSGFSAWQLPPP